MTVRKIFWAASDSDYKIMACDDHESGREVILKGVASVAEGDRLRVLDGQWKFDSRYGWSFQIKKIDHSDPTDLPGLKSYLETLPGVGPTLADAIITQLGPDCLAKIDKNPGLLAGVRTSHGRGITQAGLDELARDWNELRGKRAAMLYLAGLDVSEALAQRLYTAYGNEIIEVLRTDPYRITEIPRVGFRLADRIARSAGVDLRSLSRLAAGTEYALEQAEGEGDVFLSRDALHREARDLLGLGASVSAVDLDAAIKRTEDDKRLVVETFKGEERIYAAEMFEIESSIYEQLQGRLRRNPRRDHMRRVNPGTIEPTEQQWEAVDAAFKEPLSIMTGGPGVGKTMTLQAMVASLEGKGLRVKLVAPTGKAAKRMSEATGRKASTIHRAVGFDTLMSSPPGTPIGRKLDCDVLIIDETSMLDMRLAERLLSAVRDETNVVLVGDPDQLPPVGAGSVFLDLISSDRVPVTRLTEVFRQSADSLLLANARRVKDGLEPYWSRQEAEADLGRPVRADWDFIEAPSAERAASIAVDAAERHDIEDVMLVSPTKDGDAGVHSLNSQLQARSNPGGTPATKDGGLRIGDTVLFTKNDYRLGVVNGDLGTLDGYDAESGVATVTLSDGEERVMARDQLAELGQLGYALTVHKSQGSQAPNLISTVTEGTGARMLNRNLLYTAWTRAQSSCTVIGSKAALRAAIKVDGSRRATTLDLRVASVAVRLDQRRRIRVSVQEAMDRRRDLGKKVGDAASSRAGRQSPLAAGFNRR